MSNVVEFTMKVRPGQYAEVLKRYSAFGHELMGVDPALRRVLIVGDESQGVVRGYGVFTNAAEAAAARGDSHFAKFVEAISDLIEGPPERTILQLVHEWAAP